MREIFEFFSLFDVITPVVGFYQDFKNDPTHTWTFFFDYDDCINQGHNAVDIEKIFDKYKIKRWGSQITNGELFISVPKYEAERARRVLNYHGVPTLDR